MCEVTLNSGSKYDDMRSHINVRSVLEIVKRCRSFEHAKRKSDDEWLNKRQQLVLEGKPCGSIIKKT